MKKNRNFARNLEAFQREKRLTLTEFAEEIGIARTTLQSVLNDGNTTLDTAVRISEKVGVPLDVLLSAEPLSEEFSMIRQLVQGFEWFRSLDEERQEAVLYHLRAIREVLRK